MVLPSGEKATEVTTLLCAFCLPSAAACFLAGDHSRMGYGRRVMIAVGAGLTLRLVGFAMQSASADDAAMNVAQYLVPVFGMVGALAVIYWPARNRPRHNAVAEASA